MQKFVIIAVDKEVKNIRYYLKGDSLSTYEWVLDKKEANIYDDYYRAYFHWDRSIKETRINLRRYRVLIPNYYTDEEAPF